MKKSKKVVLIIFLVIVVLFCGCGIFQIIGEETGFLPTSTPSPTKTSTIAPTIAPTLTSTVTLSSDDAIAQKLQIGLHGKIYKITYSEDKNDIIIYWNISDNITEDLIISGAMRDASCILENESHLENKYGGVEIHGSFPMMDKYGNSQNINVVNLYFKKDTIDKINWDGFISDNIYSIADEKAIWVQFQPK